MQVDRLTPDAWSRLKAIRLRALTDAPHAFGTTLDESAAWPDTVWQRQARELETFVAVLDGEDVGMVRSVASSAEPGVAELLSAWVAPDARRRGVGVSLVDAVIDWAREEGLHRVALDVRDANVGAVAFYARCGFVRDGPAGDHADEHRRSRPTAWRLRDATEADRHEVMAVHAEAFRDLERTTWGEADATELARRRAEWTPACWEVAEREGAVVGVVRTRSSPEYDYLGTIAVSPAWQGHGLGRFLIRTAMDRAATRGVPLWLSVYRHNPARHVYVHLGFGWMERDALRLFMVWPRDARRTPSEPGKAVPEGWVSPPHGLPATAKVPSSARVVAPRTDST